MRRAITPFWLGRPSRFAGLDRGSARIALAACVALLLACLFAVRLDAPVADDQGAVALHRTIVEGVRHGGHYYAVAADAMRAEGYPLGSFVSVRLPTLAIVQASVPPLVTTLMAWALAAAVLVTWHARLRPPLTRPATRFAVAALLLGGLVAVVRRDLIVLPETWAGLLLALSLGLWRPGRWVEPVAFGLAGVLVCEAATPYLVVMGGIAFLEGRRRETIGWALATGIVTIALAAHAHAVAQVVRPLDAQIQDWATLPGLGLFVRSVAASGVLAPLPLGMAAVAIGLALFGWAGWRDPVAVRALASFAAGVVLIGVFGRADGLYRGLLFVPVLLVGLLFAVDGLRDISAAAFDRRRITVKRVVR